MDVLGEALSDRKQTEKLMHRGARDARSSHPRGHQDTPHGGPGLFDPLPPAGLTSQRARVSIREIPSRPPRRPGVRIGGYSVHALDVVAGLYGAAVLVAIFTHSRPAVAVMVAAGLLVAWTWR
jgi:hypothetical protein